MLFKLAVARQTSGEEKTDFIPCVAWREKAKFVSQWFSKGTLAVVIGQVTSRIWADDQGSNHIAFEILCDQIQFGETKRQRLDRESADKQGDAARGSLQILALDAETGMLLSGAAYDLYRADGTPVQRNMAGRTAARISSACLPVSTPSRRSLSLRITPLQRARSQRLSDRARTV